jgi:ABC-2 type transport system ATP-binding protein
VFYDYLRGREILRFVGEMHGLDRAEIDRRCAPLVERLGLADATEEYAMNYSKGMKKKLALLCAMMHDPAVLILDEPTNGLDPYATRTLIEIVKEKVAQGKTVFYSTHLLDQAEKLCHRVGIVHRGRLVAAGTLEELRTRLSKGGSLEEIFFAVTGGGESA